MVSSINNCIVCLHWRHFSAMVVGPFGDRSSLLGGFKFSMMTNNLLSHFLIPCNVSVYDPQNKIEQKRYTTTTMCSL